MVSAENRTGLYVTVPIYFCLLAGATIWAYRRMARMREEKTADHLSAHYIGGRDFGPLLITGTLFASMYSGYTVVGIPNEAFRTGWLSLRWIPTAAAINWGLIGSGFRLRKISQFRNHQSPADFITDRFQSQVLRYSVVFLQILTSVIYLAAQVIAIKSTFNSIFGLEPTTAYPVIIIMGLILIFECLGGLNSVALTDSIQGLIMVFAFVSIPLIMVKNFGGWKNLDPSTYPQPQFYQTPSGDTQWSFWQFGLINFSFFTLPHFVQRIYAVRDLQSLKIGYAVLTVGPWVSGFVGVFMGTVGVTLLVNPDDGSPLYPADPFTSILEAIMDLGGFAEACACIAITASLAAIMSTADSLIIAISQLIAVEIIYPMRPDTSPARMAWYGRASSLLSVVFALIVGLAWDEGITALGKIQFPLTAQVVPVFLIGMFARDRVMDAHPWCIAGAMLSSSIYVTGIYFGYQRLPEKNPAAIDSGITGILIQFTMIIILETLNRFFFVSKGDAGKKDDDVDTSKLLYPNRPSWDVPKMKRFGASALTPQMIWKSMEGFYEPMSNVYWNALMFFAISLTTPMVAPLEPPMDGMSFLYPPSVVNGLPWWAFKITLITVVPYVLLLVALYEVPNDFPMEDEANMLKSGVDVDLVSLTPKEMGRRSSYDESNVLVHRRRSTISTTMDELGIGGKEENQAEAALQSQDPNEKRLSNLVYAKNLSDIIEGYDSDADADEPQAEKEDPGETAVVDC